MRPFSTSLHPFRGYKKRPMRAQNREGKYGAPSCRIDGSSRQDVPRYSGGEARVDEPLIVLHDPDPFLWHQKPAEAG